MAVVVEHRLILARNQDELGSLGRPATGRKRLPS